MRRRISQREARRLLKRIQQFEVQERERRRAWSSDYPGGVHFKSIDLDPSTAAAVETVRKLGHAVVGTLSGGRLHLHALAEAREAKP